MKSHRDIGTDEQIEDHSLPGINMAGKKAPGKDGECSDEDAREQADRDRPGSVPKPDSPAD
jgi:hypothetical protein